MLRKIQDRKRDSTKFCGQEEVSDVPPPKKRKGRPCDSARKAALEEAPWCYANSEEPVPLTIILRKMVHILSKTDSDSLAYSFRQAKDLLVTEYGERVVVSDSNGKETLVTFRDTVDKILREYHQEVKADSENGERDQLIKVVGRIIRSEIKSITTRKDSYEFLNEISSVEKCLNFVCPSFCLLLSSIGVDTPRLISFIGQAIIQAWRPRGLMSAVQIGLASRLHHHFSS